MFAGVGRVAEALDLAADLPGCGPAAGLDEEGNLWLDQDVVGRVREAFVQRRDPAYIDAVERNRDRRCAALVAATRAATEAAARPDLDGGAARSVLGDVETRMSELIPYPILTKFVPELLLQALRGAGDEGPVPLPSPSPGARLSKDLLSLHVDCLAWGYPAERLEAEWPDVEPPVVTAVRSFCQEHTGFGPVTWEATGMETPEFVIGSMRAAFTGSDPESLQARLSSNPDPGADDTGAATDPWTALLRSSLRAWLEYMDLEIWYLRAAFYGGILPLLRRRALGEGSEGGVAPSDLLFAEIGELLDGRLDAATLQERRDRYWGDSEYLSRNSVRPDRLNELMERW